MKFFKQLSSRYYPTAKKLGYSWMDLVKKTTRQSVINKVINHKFTKAIKKAKKDSIKHAIRNAQLQQKMDKVREFDIQRKIDEIKRVHKKIMKKQPKTEMKEITKALKGYAKSFEISTINNKDPLAQLQNTRKAIQHHIISMLKSMKGLKFVETLKVTFKKLSNGKTVHKTAYFNSKPQTIINNLNITNSLEVSKQQILNMIAQWVSEGSGWTIQSVDNHYLNIAQYQPMKGSSYIKLPQELRHSRKGLINIENEDK